MNQGKRQKLIDAAVTLVARNGLSGFSVSKAAALAGTCERLVYIHFNTREDYLQACFEPIRERWAEFLGQQTLQTDETLLQAMRRTWEQCFRYLISGGEETLFYLDYCDAAPGAGMSPERLAELSEVFAAILDKLESGQEQELLWLHCRVTTADFVRRIIRKELPDDPKTVESIWKLQLGGMESFLERSAVQQSAG